MKLSISQILDKADRAELSTDKITVLHENDHPVLRAMLKYALDKDIKFLLPKGKPMFIENKIGETAPMQLYYEARKMYLFVEGGHATLKQDRREKLFRGFLEQLDPRDADLMCAIKDKTLPYKTLDRKLINKAFPDLI